MIQISLVFLAGVTGLDNLVDLVSEMVSELVDSSDLFFGG